MRILRISQHLYPDVTGGMPYHVHAMSRDQVSRGHDVTVVTVSNEEDLPPREERSGYEIIRCKPHLELLGNEISYDVWRHLKNEGNYDVVHAHSHYYFSTNLAALRRRLSEVRLAITNHGLYSQSAPRRIFMVYLYSLGRATFNSADLVFCYTEEDKKRVLDLGVNTPVEVVPNGVDTKRFTPEGSTSSLIRNEGFNVLFVGRLVKGKRPKDAIDAVSELSKDVDVKLYLCGNGPLRTDLKEYVTANGWENTVEFLGELGYDKMPPLYRSADALLLTSEAEGVPRTVLEALASGLPVLTSDLEQVRSVIASDHSTVPVGDIEGFAEKLKELSMRPNDCEMFSNLNRIRERYSWEKTVDETTEVLERLVDDTS